MTEQTRTTPTPKPGAGRFWGGCLRLLIFALAVAAVTAALYYATPYVYRYLVTPVQNNRAVIEHIQRSQARWQDDLEGRLNDQSQRIAQLEAESAAEREALSQSETGLAQQEEILADQAATLSELEASLEAQSQAIANLEQSLDDLDAALSQLEGSVAGPETAVTRLQRQVSLLQMQQAALKARLHLSENNAGQAQSALEEARQPLRRLGSLASPAERGALAEIEEQLEAVTVAIEEQPFTAVQELEILWQLLQEFSG